MFFLIRDEFVLFLRKLLIEGLTGAEMGSVHRELSVALSVSSLNSAVRFLTAIFLARVLFVSSKPCY